LIIALTRRESATSAVLLSPAANAPKTKKAPPSGAFCQAAEETRTLDLLHGKQTL
jgi:hypothetical protein